MHAQVRFGSLDRVHHQLGAHTHRIVEQYVCRRSVTLLYEANPYRELFI